MAEKPEDVTNVSEPNENNTEDQPIICQDSKKCLEKLQRPVGILFTGLPGSGKSTLVNTMLGEAVARTGCGPDSVEASKSYEGVFEGVQLQVYDTNGYTKARNIPSNNDRKEFDLILICIKITNRLSDSEIKLLKALGKALDKEAWKRTVIVLTFANLLLQDPKIKYLHLEEPQREVMNKLMEVYKTSIIEHLEGHMDKETADSIPFCLAGESHPYDPTVRSVRRLLTTEDWLVDLWEICANRVNPEYKRFFDRLIDFIREKFFKIFRRRTDDQQQQVEEQQHNERQQIEQDDEGKEAEEGQATL